MNIGYARVSSDDQSLALQIDALNRAGCSRIFEEKMSGAKAVNERPELQTALSHLREGDSLVVWRLDRLGRSVKGLIDLIAELEKRRVHFRSVMDDIDTQSATGRFFFHVLASLAELERAIIIQRTKAGLEAARRRGRIGGRKRLMTAGKIESAKKLLAAGMPPKDVAQSLGISVPTLYRHLPASVRN